MMSHKNLGYITIVIHLVAMIQPSVAIEMQRYEWRTGVWGGCSSDQCGGKGSTTRLVTCVETKTNRTVATSDCHRLKRPSSYTSCFRVCDYHRHQYTWLNTDWSTCQPLSGNRKCEKDYGIQYRNVTCVAICGSVAPSEVFCQHFVSKPSLVQKCLLHCPKDCVTSDFNSWTNCDSCFNKEKGRYKTILRAPENGGKPCPQLVDSEPCHRSNECYEHRSTNFKYKFSDWSDCVPLDRRTRKRLHAHPILGKRSRTVLCIDVTGRDVDMGFCSHLSTMSKPVTEQICVLPRDCLVSHWSTWSNWTSLGRPYPSGTDRDSDQNARYRDPNIHFRERNLIQVPQGDGKTCPSLEEYRQEPTHKQSRYCQSYEWLKAPWGACVKQAEGDVCGTGVQHRTVLCKRVTDGLIVEDYRCSFEAPPHTQSCDLSCPTHCVVTEWEPWGECLPDKCRAGQLEGTESHDPESYRSRRRFIQQEAASGGDPCPHLQEFQDCKYPLCYKWRAELTSSECKLKYKDMVCGEGELQRKVECLDYYGDVTDDEALCGYQPRPESSLSCYIPCGSDCVVSSWSGWTQCPEVPQCGHEGTVLRVRKRKVLAKADVGGRPCPRILEEKQKCDEISCNRYFWKTSGWSPCHVPNPSKPCTGIQTRHVSCHKVVQCQEDKYCPDSRRVGLKYCPDNYRPVTSQNCSAPCLPDCERVVSNYTEWSQCSASCLKAGETMPTQRRYRFFLDNTMASQCSHLSLIQKQQCQNLPKCLHYEWKISKWSPCVAAGGCGDGYHARDVKCVNDKGETLEEEICINQLGSMPDRVATCQLKQCKREDCVFSEWSQWSGCNGRCNGKRTRYRTMQGNTRKRTECHSPILPLEERTSCDHCTNYNDQPHGRWSSCILTEHKKEATPTELPIAMLRPSNSVCGVGRRHQALVCTDTKGNNMSASVCYQKDFVEEMCFIPCSQDCVMTEWSEWSTCQADSRCGNGQRSRFRYMKAQAIDGGRECPQLLDDQQYEYDPCHIPCEQYYWQAGDWSACAIDVQMDRTGQCGSGIQTRTLKCMQRLGSESNVVDSIKCDSIVKPAIHNYCDVICPGHCVLTEWSAWTECNQSCSGKRNRSRSIARYPSKGSFSCQHLVEIENCNQDNNCYEYSLSWSHWGSCVLGAEQACGVGVRRSYSQCVRSDGAVVDRKHCRQNMEASSAADREDAVMVKECLVHCPVDCVVSEWTPWSGCSHSCDIGYQHRYRHIVIYPASRGRKCPEELKQERPCSFTECFKWRVSDWANCEIQSGACGFGTQVRNLTCVRHDGLQVDTVLCPEGGKTHFQLSRSCLKSCPGDCWVSDWSAWGACHRPCVPDIQVGVQTRSRNILAEPEPSFGTICPHDLIETRPCRGGYCPRYIWKTSVWFGDRRHVWCESIDGTLVEGGCSLDNRPSSVRRCDPDCDVTNSYCSDVNYCSCIAGYLGIYNTYNHLIECQEQTAMHNRSKHTSEVLLPDDGLSNFWMYAVIAAGSAFILFVVVAIYVILKYSRRDHQNEMSLRSSRSTTLRQTVQGQKQHLKDTTSDTYHKDEYS